MVTTPRDVFIVHTKSDQREEALVKALVPQLRAAGSQVWLYDDWEWEHSVRDSKRGEYRRSGQMNELDLVRYAAGHPKPFRAPIEEVDEATLGEIIHGSRVVLLCEPGRAKPSEGVEMERRVMANLKAGPIIVHLLWDGAPGSYFERLRPTTTLMLTERTASTSAVDEVSACVAAAWIVHNLQRNHGWAGHRLLARVVEEEPTLRGLVERSPQHRSIDQTTRSPVDAVSMAATLAAIGRITAREFESWWTSDVTALRSKAGELGEGPAARELRALIAGVDRSWRKIIVV
jgi:hypothetical protein